MALFQRRPQTSDPINYYSVGSSETYLIIGLGNPGKEYDLTRHNIGFQVVDDFIAKTEEMEDFVQKKDLKCLLSSGRVSNKRVIVIKPTIFMNLSGEAVQAVVHFYKINPNNIVAVHDELDVEFGQIRLRKGGSDAGHNGIKSITQVLGQDFGRIRIGIGPKPDNITSEDFVLQKFNEAEQAQLPNLLRETNAILSEYLYGNELPHDTRTFIV